LHWRHEEFDLSQNPGNCDILELEQDETGRLVLTPDSRRILFDSSDHRPKRATFDFGKQLERQDSWIETSKDDPWFHHLNSEAAAKQGIE